MSTRNQDINLHAERLGDGLDLGKLGVGSALLDLPDSLSRHRTAVRPRLTRKLVKRHVLRHSDSSDFRTVEHVVPPSDKSDTTQTRDACQAFIYSGQEILNDGAVAYPKDLGDALEKLRQHFKTREIVDLALVAKINKATLYGWRDNPHGEVKKPVRVHWDRIFGPQTEAVAAPTPRPPSPTIEQLASDLAEVKGMLTQLLTLKTEPQRLEQMIAASATLTPNDREMLSVVIEALVSQREGTQEILRDMWQRLKPRGRGDTAPVPRRRRA